jgi:hypothetical protein
MSNGIIKVIIFIEEIETMYANLFGTFTGLLSLGVIVFVLLMAAFFLRLFFSGKPQNEQ